MRLHHPWIATAAGALLLTCSTAQAQRFGNRAVVPPRPMTMPTLPKTSMPNQAVMQRDAGILRTDLERNALIQRSLLARRLMMPGPFFSPMYSPYMANVNPYMANGNAYTPSASGYPMSSYPGGGYGNQMPYGGGYGSGSGYDSGPNADHGSSTHAPYTPTAALAPQEVDLYDNYFKPSLMVVPVGTTVQWMNHGRHHHTVTSNAGLWDSGALSSGGGSYSVTFTERGVYYYFCAMHPREMRGMVQVTGSGAENSGSASGSNAGSAPGY